MHSHEISPIYKYWTKQEEYMFEETEALKNCRDDLNELYNNNPNFRDEIIYFIGDKAELSNEKILYKRYEHNTLNKLGMETQAKFAFSIDCATDLVGIIASYKYFEI